MNWIQKKLNSWTDWFNGLWNTLFSTSSTTSNIKQTRNSNVSVDFTFPDTVNYDLAMNLYHNTASGYKLGAFFCHSIIFIPMAFMGFPHFTLGETGKKKMLKWWQDRLDFYNEKYIMLKQNIQKLCHITGTIAIFPWFDTKTGYVKFLFIKSKYISDIYMNPDTQELTGLVTTVNYSFNSDDGKTYYFTEKIIFTADKITKTRTGFLPAGMRSSEIRKNPTGQLPVIFANDRGPGEFEGKSEFEKVLPIIKAYSEVNLATHEIAANNKPKLIQQVDNRDTWMANNGFTDLSNISIENNDFIINKGDSEKTEIIVPQNLLDSNIKLLNLDFWGIVEGSGIPEICWGKKTEGNHASAQEQMAVLFANVKQKQQQIDEAYRELLTAIITLESLAYNQTPPEEYSCTWNELSTLTEVERAEVFNNYCTGFQKLSDSHSINLEGIHSALLQLMPDMITEDFEEFRDQVKQYGSLKAFLNQEYGGMRDFQKPGDNGQETQITGQDEEEVPNDEELPEEEKTEKAKPFSGRNGNGNGKKKGLIFVGK